MASRVTSAPVYRDLMRLVLQLRTQRNNIAVAERFFWSDFVLRTAYGLLGDVHKAYDATPDEKLPELRGLLTTLNTLETYIRIAKEGNVISTKASANIWLALESIGKQLTGWIKSIKDSMPEV